MKTATTYVYPASFGKDEAGRYVVRFRDLPEALTDGATLDEALCEASDALSEALTSRIVDREEIPLPSEPNGDDMLVAPDATVALKAAFHAATREVKFNVSKLAKMLEVDRKEVRRLLDPNQPSKLPRLQYALSLLGYVVSVSVYPTDDEHSSREIIGRRLESAAVRGHSRQKAAGA